MGQIWNVKAPTGQASQAAKGQWTAHIITSVLEAVSFCSKAVGVTAMLL